MYNVGPHAKGYSQVGCAECVPRCNRVWPATALITIEVTDAAEAQQLSPGSPQLGVGIVMLGPLSPAWAALPGAVKFTSQIGLIPGRVIQVLQHLAH